MLTNIFALSGICVLALGLSDREREICEQRAQRETTDFSAKKTYERCAKSIREELRDAAERKAHIERQKAAQEAAKEAARQRLIPGIKQRCLDLLPQWRKLRDQTEDRRFAYNLERKALIEKVTDLYGRNYAQYFRSKGINGFSEYPDEILKDFPWIRWYGNSLKQQSAILKEIAGIDASEQRAFLPVFVYTLLYSECSDRDANELADHLVDIRN